MALWSCIQQLSEQSPQEELSLPWVHLAYQHFRIRLQNFSRILTLHPAILDSLTKAARSRDLATREMVWPLLGTVSAPGQHLAFLEWVGAAPRATREGELTGRAANGRVQLRARAPGRLRWQGTSNRCLLWSDPGKRRPWPWLAG